jgi:DNA primase (bacterial type)
MAGRIRDEDVALVRERARIDDVVREHVTLKSAGGGSLKGLCPFHDERTPSFHVTPSRGMWYCFGCGEGGDVINFVQRVDHLTFAETIEKLADKTGVQLRYVEGGAAINRQQGVRTRLVEAHKAASAFYREQLTSPAAQWVGSS